ncbi:MAG: hypothetical protein J6D57_14700, partial [Mogibacterium sp.]|nr:hypothetical protein [Mogibacterium sp.]
DTSSRPKDSKELSETVAYPYNLIAEIIDVDPNTIDPQDYPEDIEEIIGSAFEKCLREREVFIMEERFIEEKSLQDIGSSLELSRERVRQLMYIPFE